MRKASSLINIFIWLLFLAACTAREPGQPASVVLERSIPSQPTPVVSTYVSENAHFSIEYPTDYTLYTHEKPGVDGVTHPLPQDAISIRRDIPPSFLLTVQPVLLTENQTVEALAGYASCSVDLSAGQTILIENQPALVLPDLPCGPYGASLILLLRGSEGYLITIESHEPYQKTSETVMQLLSTFKHDPAN